MNCAMQRVGEDPRGESYTLFNCINDADYLVEYIESRYEAYETQGRPFLYTLVRRQNGSRHHMPRSSNPSSVYPTL